MATVWETRDGALSFESASGLISSTIAKSWFSILILLGVCGALFFYGLDGGELWRTEGLRAIIAKNMLETGDWIVPTLYGEPLFTKPPGMYLAIVLCSWPFGAVTEWSARLPSALAATATVFLFYWYFRRRLGRTAGLGAALILPMSPMWLDKASAAEIDMLQVFWVAGSILFFLRAVEEAEKIDLTRQDSSPAKWWILALLCVAGGFLTKWTAPAFFYASAVPFLWWRGRLPLLRSWPHLVSALLAAGICLGWVAAAVAQAGWAPFFETVSREALQRIVPSYSPKPYPWLESLLHPFKLWVTMLPWSFVALWALRPGFFKLWDDKGRFLLQAMHCWIWPNVLIWSCMTEHTPRHSFPLFPGISGLAVLVWLAWNTGRLSWNWPRISPYQVLVGFLAFWLVLKIIFVHAVVPHRNAERQPRIKAGLLASWVPAEKILYLFRLKDEGIMFYFGRKVLRLSSPDHLPAGETVYCILMESEWRQGLLERPGRPAEVVTRLTDEQGDSIVLVRIHSPSKLGG